jgi:hypothetical protein
VITARRAEPLDALVHADPASPQAHTAWKELSEAREELAELAWWARIDAFDRRAANRALAALSTCPKERSQPDLPQFGTPSWVG